MYIQTNASLTLKSAYDQLFAFYKEKWIQNTTNLKHYDWNTVVIVIVIDLPLKKL